LIFSLRAILVAPFATKGGLTSSSFSGREPGL
jgi:hypothetical protein